MSETARSVVLCQGRPVLLEHPLQIGSNINLHDLFELLHLSSYQEQNYLKHLLDLADLNLVCVQVHHYHHVVSINTSKHLGLLLFVRSLFIALVLSILKRQMLQNVQKLFDLLVEVGVGALKLVLLEHENALSYVRCLSGEETATHLVTLIIDQPVDSLTNSLKKFIGHLFPLVSFGVRKLLQFPLCTFRD